MSDKSKNVEFFKGQLTDGKFWNDQLEPIPISDGIGMLEYYVSKGSFKMETINIICRAKTSLDNYQILQREYNLALENKF